MSAPTVPPARDPLRLPVRVEIARWSFVKRDGCGRVHYVSPVPCPFNYGAIPGTRAADGAGEDALLLGPRVRRGTVREAYVVAVVEVVDAGLRDDKWVLADEPRELRAGERLLLRTFFHAFVLGKRVLAFCTRASGPTRFERLTDARELRRAPPGVSG